MTTLETAKEALQNGMLNSAKIAVASYIAEKDNDDVTTVMNDFTEAGLFEDKDTVASVIAELEDMEEDDNEPLDADLDLDDDDDDVAASVQALLAYASAMDDAADLDVDDDNGDVDLDDDDLNGDDDDDLAEAIAELEAIAAEIDDDDDNGDVDLDDDDADIEASIAELEAIAAEFDNIDDDDDVDDDDIDTEASVLAQARLVALANRIACKQNKQSRVIARQVLALADNLG